MNTGYEVKKHFSLYKQGKENSISYQRSFNLTHKFISSVYVAI